MNKLIIEDNHSIINGVIKVKTATESIIDLLLENESITINGTNMHITKLDLVEKTIELEGKINCVKYGKSKESILKKVFK